MRTGIAMARHVGAISALVYWDKLFLRDSIVYGFQFLHTIETFKEITRSRKQGASLSYVCLHGSISRDLGPVC